MKKVCIILISFMLFSCNNDPAKTVDPSKIIGQKYSSTSPPYGTGYDPEGYKYINETHYRVYGVYYKNKVIVYVLGMNYYIIDYFFSNMPRLGRARKIPLGISYEEVVEKLGEPVFSEYPGILYELADYDQNTFKCQYIERYFNKKSFKYEVTNNAVNFYFDNEGKLKEIRHVWEWRP